MRSNKGIKILPTLKTLFKAIEITAPIHINKLDI